MNIPAPSPLHPHTQPSMNTATDKTDLDAVIESLNGKGLAESLNQVRLIVWMKALGYFEGVGLDWYVERGWDQGIHACVYPDGRVVTIHNPRRNYE